MGNGRNLMPFLGDGEMRWPAGRAKPLSEFSLEPDKPWKQGKGEIQE
jgi:hypothetical protein